MKKNIQMFSVKVALFFFLTSKYGLENLAFSSQSEKNPHVYDVTLSILMSELVSYEPHYEKKGFCISENKDADQLRGNREADQRLGFCYTDSTIPLLPKSQISSL